MSNITAIRNLAAGITCKHFFSNVEDFTAPAYEVFVSFMSQIQDIIENDDGDRTGYAAFDDGPESPIVWEPFADDTVEILHDNIVGLHNMILHTSVEQGLVTIDDIQPFLIG